MNTELYRRSDIVKNVLGNCVSLLGNINHSPSDVIVLYYHGTQKKFISDFEKQLDFYERHFEIIDPKTFKDSYRVSALNNSEKPRLLLTFDDGIKNNLYAVEALNRRNIKAFFFVIPGFVETPDRNQKQFYRSNLFPVTNPNVDSGEDDFSAMTWPDLSSLLSDGHAIGSHSYTHALTHSESDSGNSRREIVDSKRILEEKLSCLIDSYCSPVDTLMSTGKKEMALIKEHYSFHFSTYPGSNCKARDPYFVKRAVVNTFWPLGTVKYSIGRFDRIRWKKERALVQLVCREASYEMRSTETAHENFSTCY